MLKLYNYKNSSLRILVNQLFSDFDLAKHKRIFIKPNLGGRYPIIKGENTNYDIVKCICEIFKENGCQEIIIGHTSLLNFGNEKYDFETLFKKSNFYNLTRNNKIIKFLNLDKTDRATFAVKGIRFNLPKILETHFYINLCNLKTHMETAVSLSLKNQMGLLLTNEKMRMHQTDLDKYIAYLGLAAKPDLNIIDGRIGMEGNGPHNGLPKQANIILCGDDMVEIDSLACLLMGIDFKTVNHVRFAIEEKVGSPIKETQSDLFKDYRFNFKPASKCYEKHNLRVWPNKACSGCIFTLNDAYKTIRKNPIKFIKFIGKIVKDGKIDILLGKNTEANAACYSKNIFAIGNCTRDFAKANNVDNFLIGCPPSKKDIINFLTKNQKDDQ